MGAHPLYLVAAPLARGLRKYSYDPQGKYPPKQQLNCLAIEREHLRIQSDAGSVPTLTRILT
jgi:hypothetical protein